MSAHQDGETFFKWMTEIAKCFPGKFPENPFTLSDAQRFINANKLQEPLLYLCEHLRPPVELEHIRLNLRHAKLRQDIFLEEGLDPSNEERNIEVFDLEEVRRSLNADMQELAQLGGEEEKLLCKEKELKRQITLRRQFTQEKNQDIMRYKKWVDELKNLADNPDPPSKNSEEETSYQMYHAKEEIVPLLNDLKGIRLELLSEDKDLDVHKRKVKMWEDVSALTGKYHPSVLLETLKSISIEEVSRVTKEVQEVDLLRDARDLGLKQTSEGDIIEEDDSSCILRTEEEMLIQMNANHIQARVEAHRIKASADSAKAAVKVLKGKILPTAKEILGDEGDIPEKLQLMAERKLALAGTNAAIEKTKELIQLTERDIQLAKLAHQNLMHKYNKIQHFEEDLRKNTLLIKSLALSLNSAFLKLNDKKNSVLRLMEEGSQKLNLKERKIVSFSDEFNALTQLPFERLHLGLKDGKLAPLSTLCPLGSSILDDETQKILSSVAPSSSHWVSILDLLRREKRMKAHKDDFFCLERTKYETMIAKCKNIPFFSLSFVEELSQKVQNHDRELEKKFLPLLEEMEKALLISQEELKSLEKTIHYWWNGQANKL